MSTLLEWNDTAHPFPACTLTRLLEEQAACTPEAIALSYAHAQLDYQSLHRAANRLAHRLIERGAGPERVVGIAMHRSIDLVVALLAVLKTGAAYLPLDPEYPRQRLADMIDNAQPVVVLSLQPVAQVLPPDTRVLCLDDPDCIADVQAHPGHNPSDTERTTPLLPDHPAYVIYTSGSTGKPKGVVNCHRGLVNRLAWMQAAYCLEPGDRVLQKTPANFDVSVWEFFWPLLTGAQLVVAKPEGHRNAAYLVELIRATGITVLHFVPSMLQAFVQEPGVEQCRGLRRVICSGEALPKELQQQLHAKLAVSLHNLYGPTEAAIDVTAWECRDEQASCVPIGKPIWNTQIHLLDGELRPVLPGESGELCIAGECLARGYLGRPDLTASSFIANPHAAAGSRMYRTGDLARWRPDGNLDFLGRIDHQVKIRGVRIELGEIQMCLASHPLVVQAAVIAREYRPGRKQLVAYVVPRSTDFNERHEGGEAIALDHRKLVASLRQHVAAQLPEYMAPAAILCLDRLPVTANGKLDRKSLPAPDFSPTEGRAPDSPAEQQLAALFAQVLGLQSVSADVSLFELGGDSIVALQLVSRAFEAGLSITAQQVFQLHTVAGLAAVAVPVSHREASEEKTALWEALLHDEQRAAIEAEYSGVVDILPLSPLQRGLLFHASFASDGTDPYVLQMVTSLRGQLDVDRLRRSLATLLRRHPNLCARFRHQDLDEPVQILTLDGIPVLRFLDLSRLQAMLQHEEIERVLGSDRAQAFDLERRAPARYLLLRLESERHLLVVTAHHIVIDGWSLQLALRELLDLYHFEGNDRALPVVVPFRNYLAFAARQDRDAARQAWRKYLHGLSGPLLLSRSAGQTAAANSDTLSRGLSAAATRRLCEFARAHSLTLNTLVQAAWCLVLSKLTGSDDIVFGITVSGRSPGIPGVERIIGMLLHTLPVYIRLNPATPVVSFLAELQSRQSSMLEHQHLGLAEIQALANERGLFDTLLNFENYPRAQNAAAASDRLRIEASHFSGDGASHYPLSIRCALEECLAVELTFLPGHLQRAQVERMAACLERAFEQICANPHTPLGQLGLLSQEAAVPSHTADVPLEPSDLWDVARLFEHRAAETPHATALTWRQEVWSYQQLNTRANQLAHYLLDAGLRDGQPVAVALPRSSHLIVAMLAAFKAGTVYLPLDPEYPAERLRFALEDVKPAVLLSLNGAAPWAMSSTRVCCLDEAEFAGALSRKATGNPHRQATTQLPSYIIYTSGSTGKPKGVLVKGSSLALKLITMGKLLGADASMVFATLASSAFDISLFEQLIPLVNGGQLIMVDSPQGRDLHQLVEQTRGATALFAVPSLMSAWLEHLQSMDALALCPRIDCLLTGGEAVPASLLKQMRRCFPAAQILGLYGPTEVSIISTYYRPRFDTDEDLHNCIGAALDDVQLCVLDQHLQPQVPGWVGELYLRGPSLARGYLGRPALTAERFVANPWGRAGDRLFRTGDLVRERPDGQLEFAGRRDHQVKIRGLRIELGEVETCLQQHATVDSAVAVVRESSPGKSYLAAYVTAKPGQQIDVQLLRLALKDRLPAYMVPQAIVVMEALPLNVNDKVDRKALPAPERRHEELSDPRNDVERTLACLFANLLGLPSVGVDDGFFDLGGDSISSMQLASRARKVGLILSPKDIFEHQSVAALARIVRLETGPRTGDDAPVGPCRQTPILSAFLEQHGVVGQFCQYRWLQTPASLRLRDLSAVVQALLDRHDALRMRVHAPQENQWQLEIPPPGAVLAAACLTRRDIRSWSAAGLQESATEELFAATRGLSPTRGVLLQAVWFDAGDRPGRLLLVVHHWAIDGVSWRVLLPDLESAWRAVVAQQNIQLDATGNSFRNWAERLYVEAHSPARAAELDYWKRIVAHPDTLLSQRRLEPRDTVATRGRIQLHMPPLVTRAVLSEVPALFHARINDVLLTALALAIRVWRRATGTDRSISAATGVRVDVEGHGRESLFEGLDWSRTVGWFTSEFPAWLDTGELDLDAAMNGRAPVGQALKRIKEQLRELPDHGIGFGLLLHINGSTASHLRSHAPAQIGFNYMGRFDGVSAADWSPAPELDGVPEPLDATLPLTHSIVLDAVVNDRLDGPHLEAAWTWAANLFDEEAIRRLGSHWFEALRSLVEYARQPGAGGLTPSDLSLLQLKQSEIDSLEAEFSLQSLPSDLDES